MPQKAKTIIPNKPKKGVGKGGNPNPQSGPHRTPTQRELDRAELPKLIRRGWTQQMIAEKFKVHQSMISLEWKIIVKQFREEANLVTEELIALKLQEYAEIKKEAWEAWEKSKQDAEEFIEEDTSGPRGGSTKTGTKRRGQCGEAGYLNILLRCLEAERELQGLNPAKEIKGTINTVNWDVLANGIDPTKPVPDEVENEIRKALGMPEMLPDASNPDNPSNTVITEDGTIYVQPAPQDEAEGEEGE